MPQLELTDILEPDELAAIVRGSLEAQGGRAAEDDMIKVVEWAKDLAIGRFLLQQAIDGDIVVAWSSERQSIMFALPDPNAVDGQQD